MLGEDSTCAVGSALKAAPSALPAGDSLTVQRRPYTGGETVPTMLSMTFHPASLRVKDMWSAKRLASKSPNFVSSTLAPRYWLSARTSPRCCSGLIRRAANLSSIFGRARRSCSGSPCCLCPQPPQYLHHPRDWEARGPVVHRHGVFRLRDAEALDRSPSHGARDAAVSRH